MMNKVYFMEFDEKISEQKYEDLFSFLPWEKRQRILRFHFTVDKKLSLLADILVRCVVCQTYNIKNKDLVFAQNDFGKPYLTGHPFFQYNISHTRNALVVGISEEALGIDIEKVRQADLRIADRFFTASEVKWISAEEQEVDARFYEIWTKKEAYLKWLGKGLFIPLSSFDVTDVLLNGRLSSVRFHDYMISVCPGIDLEKENIEIWTEQKLLETSFSLL